ncbi:macrophage colony-stimulating factor 1 receptor [Carettochelys insculpta]|uniref:macrophage colony-stimulating factor 1 receptor n=1 Tax=Carettochelys insculpta TaxID=44489 RepID=UPI003EBBFF25
MDPGILVLLVATGIWHGSAAPTINPNVTTLLVNKNDAVTLHCSGDFSVKWVGTRQNVLVQTNSTDNILSITRASYRDTGTYRCVYTNHGDMESTSIHLFVRDPEKVWYVHSIRVRVEEGRDAQLPCLITDPEYGANVTLLMDDNSPVLPGTKFSFSAQDGVTIYNVQQEHKGFYRCGALINGNVQRSPKIRLILIEAPVKPPSVTVEQKDHVRIQGESFQLTCHLISPSHKFDIKWVHPAENVTISSTNSYANDNYHISNTLYIPAVTVRDSGQYSCVANNSVGSSNSSTVLQVVERGYIRLLPMQNSNAEVKLGGNLKLQVQIEAYPTLSNWSWTQENPSKHFVRFLANNQMIPGNNRYNTTLSLSRLQNDESGLYTFHAANAEAQASVTFNVSLKIPPEVRYVGMAFNNSTSLLCIATGYPAPHIEWYQCPGHADRSDQQMLILNETSPRILSTEPFGNVEVESILQIKELGDNLTFCCWAINSEGNDVQSHSLVPSQGRILMLPNELFKPILSISMATLVLLFLLLVFLLFKYNQKPKYQVRWKIIEACEGNNYIFIDPTQLPYNEKWEFPRNNLQFGKTLGAGAFGKVVEATAFGLGKEDAVLKVAVKMLKSTAHADEQEALMSELKIMSHLGHHENIVNLLGACTYGGPILVITEYCRYGDLLNFLRKKAESIIIQDSSLDSSLDSMADYKNIYLGKKYVRSDSGFGSQGLETYVEMRPVPSDFTPAGSSLQGKSADEEQEDARPLELDDLLQFSNQVAQGMAFLASKNCIHRDLAARNVLVTHGRVAKICDFGLARDIMNDSNYVVKGNARLPVKWMAPESIFDCIYTVQSDVWSYGILLWEIFSLGKSPYPGMLVNSKFYSMVKQGYQMARPDFAPMEMYRIMQACWNLQPTQRLTFDQICQLIQKQLDANKEQDYTNLPSSSEEDSVCEPSDCCEESCEQRDSSQPLLKSNNYQFC